MRWRDERESARLHRGEVIAPATLAEQERSHVAEVVAVLRPRRLACELTWSMLMQQAPSNPGLRLREEALLQILELPPRDYDRTSVGWAGVTASGRPPLAPPK